MKGVSVGLGWRKLRETIHGFRCSMRSASLLGRAFSLRDRGRLEEALTVCREALRVAQDPRGGIENTITFSTVVVGALAIDEIATRLGTPDLARGPLEDALRMFELFKRKASDSSTLTRAVNC